MNSMYSLRTRSLGTSLVVLAAVQLFAFAAMGANFTTSVTQGSGANWNAAIWQPGPVAPTAGNTYECIPTATLFGNNQGNVRIRNPATAGVQTFVGDSLTLRTNTEIRAKQAGAILNFPGVGGNPGLIMKGGVLNAGDTAVFEIQGRVHVASTSLIAPGDNGAGGIIDGRGIKFNASSILTGTNGFILIQGPINVASLEIASANNNNFSGDLVIKCGFLKGSAPGSLGNGNIIIDPNATIPSGLINPATSLNAGPARFELTYDIASPGKLTLANGGVMILHQNCTFAAANINGTELAAGVYTYAQLSSSYPSNFAPGGSGSITVQPPAPPSAPTGLSALNFDSAVKLTWSPTAKATGYNVKRGDLSGGPYVTIASTVDPTFTDSTVINGTTYYYVVSATNAVGESANSAEAVGNPNLDVEGVTATGGTNQITVSWTALPIATSYSVKRSSISGGPYTTVASGIADTSYTDTGLGHGQTYYYIVGATLAGGGESGQSAEASAATAPGAPTLRASLWASTFAKLTWTGVDPVVTGFSVEQADDGVTFTEIASVGGTARGVLASNLLTSKTYTFRIRAVNGSGSSPYSDPVTVRTPIALGTHVNFGSATNNSAGNPVAPIPDGYVQDVGNLYGDRGNGFFYGWNREISADGRYRRNANSPDVRYDTFVHLNKTVPPAVWEMDIPNGFYAVHIVGGDPDNLDSVIQFNVEGVITGSYVPTAGANWGEFTVTCIVNDGKLTITAGPLSQTTTANDKISFVDVYPAVAVPIMVDRQPQGATALENRPLSLSVTYSNAFTPDTPFYGSEPVTYQWYRDGIAIPDGTNAAYATKFAQTSQTGDYYVVLSNFAGSVTSDTVHVTVDQDNEPPHVVSVGSIDGYTVGMCFDELVDGQTAGDNFNYFTDNPNISVFSATLRPDGKSVQLVLDLSLNGGVPASGPLTITAQGIVDLTLRDANAGGGTMTANVLGYTSADIGGPGQAGSSYTCDGNALEIIGGGGDIWNNSDQFRFVSKGISGDFDARVRVTGVRGSNTIAKAALLARETADPGARALHLSVNAPPPSRDQGEAGFRAAINGATAAWHTNSYVPAGVPNAWIRMTRSGNSFTGYRSSDGVNWIQFAQTNQTYTSSILVGLGVTAHDNGLLATGQFSNFTLTQPTADLAISQTARTQVRQGSNITYSITVNNGGPDAANLVKVVDTVPTGSTHISSSASQGACALAAGVVTCDLGTLVSGASATVTIVVRADATGSINNTASVSSAAVDSNAANNSATASTASYTQPQVGSTSYASSGGGSTFTMNVATLNGLNYAVEYKNSLDDATWTVLTTFPGTGAVVPVPDSTAGSVPTRFYRVVILEP